MSIPRVSEVASREYPSIDKNETLEEAWRLIEKEDIDKLIVLSEGKPEGILATRDIMLKLGTERTRRTVPGRLHVSSFMTTSLYTVKPDAALDEAARLMLEQRVAIGSFEASIGALPVVEGGEVKALLTKWDVARFASEKLRGVKASDVMTVKPFILRWMDKVAHARRLMAENDVSFIPVVDEENRLMGYITVREVAIALLAFHDIVPEKYRKERFQHLLVHDVMRLRPPRVDPDTPLSEVAAAILEKRSRGAVVMQDERIVGIITLDEILKYVAYELPRRG